MGDKALLLLERRELSYAKKLLKDQEEICRRLDHINGLTTALTYQAVILCEQGRLGEGLSLAEEAYRLAADRNDETLTRKMRQILLALREQAQRKFV